VVLSACCCNSLTQLVYSAVFTWPKDRFLIKYFNIDKFMAGLTPTTPVPINITVHESSRVLELEYETGEKYKIAFELMRVFSPSAEVRGHSPGQEVLQTGKRLIQVTGLEPVGNYGIQPTFSDGHSSGIFSWDYLHYLATKQEALWAEYELKLKSSGVERDAPMNPGAQGLGHESSANGSCSAT
jgi:DUF971 family protein